MSSSKLRALARITLGSALLIYEEIVERLPDWEEKSQSPGIGAKAIMVPSAHTRDAGENREPSDIQDILLGVVADAEDRLERSLSKADYLTRELAYLASSVSKPILSNKLAAPFVTGFYRLVNKGEDEIERWRTLGRSEREVSKSIARTVFKEQLDSAVEYLSVNPELQTLIQGQSAGLANEVVEEIRERTVSADNLLEGLVRGMLRRSPREELPEPPEQVIAEAAPVKQLYGRTLRK